MLKYVTYLCRRRIIFWAASVNKMIEIIVIHFLMELKAAQLGILIPIRPLKNAVHIICPANDFS